MSLAGSNGGGQADEADNDEDDGPGVAEVEEAATHFGEQKEHTDGNHHDGAHEASDGAALAIATNTFDHLS
jgi:hypothetical protein